MSIFVFAYGSNLDSERMKARAPSAVAVGVSELPQHALRFHKRSAKDGTGKANAFLTDSAADRVEGVIYQIDPAELAELDRVEGRGYERRLMPFSVRTKDQISIYEAWIYVAQPSYIDDSLAPARWYVRHVLEGAKEHGLSSELVAWLESRIGIVS